MARRRAHTRLLERLRGRGAAPEGREPPPAEPERPKRPKASVARLGGAVDPVPVDHPRGGVRLTASSARNRDTPYAKEPWTVEWIERCMGQGEVLYDVGANVGAYSLIAGATAGAGSRVVAFEPGYATYAALCDNVVLNDLAAVVTPLQVALGARTELTTLELRDLRPGAAHHVLPGEATTQRKPVLYRQPLFLFRLDDLVEKTGLPAPNHLKLDVDGHELDVLHGAPRTLADGSLRTLMIEVEAVNAEAVGALLEAAGFAESERHSMREEAELTGYWYSLFVRSGSAPTGA